MGARTKRRRYPPRVVASSRRRGGVGSVAGAEALSSLRSFLETSVERVQAALDDGLSKSDAVDALSFDDVRPPLHPTAASHRHDVDRLYDVLSGRRE